ncbi:hypothetical protein ACFLT0_01550 [Chloroflexota bacterium]
MSHNYCYRKWYYCVNNSVTERRTGDTTQHTLILRGSVGAVSPGFKEDEGDKSRRVYSYGCSISEGIDTAAQSAKGAGRTDGKGVGTHDCMVYR